MPAPDPAREHLRHRRHGDWEFEEEDLFGRGFEMKALASAPLTL